MKKKCILILGGARSGKSSFAQILAKEMGEDVLFVATAEPLDEEMRARIEEHKKGRPKSWQTLEIPLNVGKEIAKRAEHFPIIILDCLTLFISNLLTREGEELDSHSLEEVAMKEIGELIECINKVDATFIVVSNEVGTGLVPNHKIGRAYRDILGKSNQLLAQLADEVYLMVAGIPMKIKSEETL